MTQDVFQQFLHEFNEDIRKESEARIKRGEKERKILFPFF